MNVASTNLKKPTIHQLEMDPKKIPQPSLGLALCVSQATHNPQWRVILTEKP